MKAAILQNYLTTIFGILAGLPVLALTSLQAAGVAVTPTWTHILGIVGAVGLIGLGIVAKAFNTHSTTAQAAAATADVTNNPAAPQLMKAADAQVAAKK